MKEKTIKIYQFDELLPEVQRKVIDHFRETSSIGFEEPIYMDASFVGIRLTSWNINKNYCEIAFQHSAIATAEAILKEHGACCETYKAAKAYLEKIAILEKEAEQLENNNEDVDFRDFGRAEDAFQEILEEEYLKMLTEEYDRTQTDEYIIEFIKESEYYFRDNGNIEAEA